MTGSMHIPSQSRQIISYLEDHEYITSLDAVREFGCTRLAARISDLQREGCRFDHKPVVVKNRNGKNVRVMSYALMGGSNE